MNASAVSSKRHSSRKKKAEPDDDVEVIQKLARLDVDDDPEISVYGADDAASPSAETHRKRKGSPLHNSEDYSKVVRMDDDDDAEDPEQNVIYSNENTYHKGGLVHSLHGNIYQLKVQILFLKHALDKGYEFNLGTEVEEAEKFDDIVFKYKKEGVEGVRFVQIKHKQNEARKISADDLLKDENSASNDFSLQKYFISYGKIKKNPLFSRYKLKDFIIYTNIDFDDLEKACIQIKTITGNDDILELTGTGNNTKRCKLIIPKDHELIAKLKQTSDTYILAHMLYQHIQTDKTLNSIDIFKLYHTALCKEVFKFLPTGTDVTKSFVKFRDDFLCGNNLLEKVSYFRDVLRSVAGSNLDQFWKELSFKEIQISKSFGEKTLEVLNNPTITDTEGLAEKFMQFILEVINKQDHIVTIKRTSHIIKNNINKLAFHILVQDENPDLVRFRKVFFDDNHKLEGNLEEFKEALKTVIKKYGIHFDALAQYKFKITEFHVCKETAEGQLLYPKNDLPTDRIDDNDIEDFFEKLTFAVNQPNEDELGKIIAQEIGQSTKFNLGNPNLVFDSLQRSMLDWFKEKRPAKGEEGVWLNARSGQMFVNSLEQQMCSLVSIGISFAYTEKLASHGITFESNSIVFRELKDFLSAKKVSRKILQVIAPTETLLSAININGSLDSLKQEDEFSQYNKNDSYIFVNLNTLLGIKAQESIIKAFESSDTYNLLIIDCGASSPTYEIQKIFWKLTEILGTTSKKVILIGIKQNDFSNAFPNGVVFNVEDTSNFVHLTEKSKDTLLQNVVNFQGQHMRFSKLIDKYDDKVNDTINTNIIHMLLKGEEISIGSEPQSLREISDYYIHRRFKQVILSRDKIVKNLEENSSQTDLLVISGTGIESKHRNMLVLDKPEAAESKFKELCEQYPKANIHWLQSHQESKYFIWHKSHGSISSIEKCRIRDYVKPDSNCLRLIEENEFISENTLYKIIIISDTAGMGKSTVLTQLGMKLKHCFENLWVYRINLNDHTRLFNANLKIGFKNLSKIELMDRVLNDLLALKEPSGLEYKLFYNNFVNNGNVALLFDGFDEISPKYKNLLIDLLLSLKNSGVKRIFVTTRPNLRTELENALEVFTYELEPLTKNEQIEFLTMFWMKKFDLQSSEGIRTERLRTYVNYVFDHISKATDIKAQAFIGIPLQTMMVAEVFQDSENAPFASEWQGCKEFLASQEQQPILLKKQSLLDLYDHFIKRKFYEFHLTNKKKRDLTIVDEDDTADDEYKSFKDRCVLLALHVLFNKGKLKTLLCPEKIQKLDNLCNGLKNYKHNEGIIDQVIEDRPHFIHRTFAEYFASEYIAEEIKLNPAKTLSFLDSIVFEVNHRHPLQLSKGDPITGLSAIFFLNLIKHLDGKYAKISASLQMPFLCYVMKEKQIDLIDSFIRFDYSDWPRKLDEFCKTPLHYAIEQSEIDIAKRIISFSKLYNNENLVNFINMKDVYGKTALNYVLEKNEIPLSIELLSLGAKVESLNDIDFGKLTTEILFKGTEWRRETLDDMARYLPTPTTITSEIIEILLKDTVNRFKNFKEGDQTNILKICYLYKRMFEKLYETLEDSEVRNRIFENISNETLFDKP